MRRALREHLQTALLALVLLTPLQASIQNYRVEGSSMEPLLSSDQYLLVNKLIYYRLDKSRLARYIPFLDAGPGGVTHIFHPPQRDDIVVFRYPKDPSRNFVKRIIAVPGDTVEVRFGKVYVNGALQDEPYVLKSSRSSMVRTSLASEEYFVMGDNRPHSSDSQDWGAVPLENILGKAWLSYWPVPKAELF